MAEQKTNHQEKLKEIISNIETGIQELFQSEKFAGYLRTMSRFHKYSVNNTILIYLQRPDAAMPVAGFRKWQQFGRHVKKGEKGLTIIAPTPFKKKIEEIRLDPDTKAPVLDQDGNAIMDEKIIEIPLFKPVKVFSADQTDGEPLPSLSTALTGDVQQYEAFMEALRRTSPMPVVFGPLNPDMDGLCSFSSHKITIRENMSQVQTVCATVHEIGHAVLHDREKDRLSAGAGNTEKEPHKAKDTNTMEVEAESVSFAVCQYYGIDTSANSLGYIAGWSKDRSLPELKASLETITKAVSGLISSIDEHFAEVCKERGIAPAVQPEQTALEPEFVYKMEVNADDQHCIQVYKRTETETVSGQILFAGQSDVCASLLEQLNSGALRQNDFITVSAARFSPYVTADGAELDVFVGKDDKVYIGRQDHYDNRGHYLNNDRSFIHVSDNERVFHIISGVNKPYTTEELAATGFFSQEELERFTNLPIHAEPESEQTAPPPSQQSDEPQQDTKLDEYPLPDNLFTAEELRQNYGYMDGDMLPLSKDRAAELLDKDFTVYAIVNGGSAEMVLERDELNEHPPDRMFAVSKEEWEGSLDFRQAAAARMDHQSERERAFLDHTGDCFAIYHLRRDNSTRYLRYEPLENLRKAGQSPLKGNYELVYTGGLSPGQDLGVLEALWTKFNTDHPADYQHPSISISDILAVKLDGVVSCYYVDHLAFTALPGFFQADNYLKNAEMQAEDDFNMLDGIINNGPKEPAVADLEAPRKSVVQKLNNKPKQDRKKSDEKTNKTRRAMER